MSGAPEKVHVIVDEVSIQKKLDGLVPKLIEMVYQVLPYQNFGQVFSHRENDEFLGKNQIRTMVDACLQASCVEEVKALIAYKVGKDAAEGRSKGKRWDKSINNEKFGKRVITGLNDIDKMVVAFSNDDKAKLKAYAKFFGYFYWRLVAWEGGMGNDL